jgi:hypothetical protein
MPLASIYFIPGLAMVLVVLWDYNKLPATASRIVKRPQQGVVSQFSRIALEVRNLTVMALFALLLWPWVVWMELSENRK